MTDAEPPENDRKKLSTDKETRALNVCRTISTLLTKVSMSNYCLALRSNDYEAQRNASHFRKLVDREWKPGSAIFYSGLSVNCGLLHT